MAYFAVALYNMTEAAFKETHPIWIVFLLAVILVPNAPRRKDEREYSAST